MAKWERRDKKKRQKGNKNNTANPVERAVHTLVHQQAALTKLLQVPDGEDGWLVLDDVHCPCVVALLVPSEHDTLTV